MELQHYLNDGANYQAKAVLAFLQTMDLDAIYDGEKRRHEPYVKVSRWDNCRERRYVVYLNSPDYQRQFNVIFFEHRNSDNICAVKWEQKSVNPISNYDSADFGDVYKDKYDVSFRVSYGEIVKMADWIKEQFEAFWSDCSTNMNSQILPKVDIVQI